MVKNPIFIWFLTSSTIPRYNSTGNLGLNNTAFMIWQKCDGCGIEELVNRVMQVCNLSPEQYYTTVKNDCEDILSYLLENELIKEENV